jgi:hypothetical protein
MYKITKYNNNNNNNSLGYASYLYYFNSERTAVEIQLELSRSIQ